jgi:hypothetical protein
LDIASVRSTPVGRGADRFGMNSVKVDIEIKMQ